MKRIINGVTYNTDTATIVARYEYQCWEHENRDVEAVIYKTRGGALFIVHAWQESDGYRTQEKHYFEATDREALGDLATKIDNLEIIDNSVLADPPEAEEVNPERTIILRVPASLGDRITDAAKKAGLSMNAFMIRCSERCSNMEAVGERLGEILQTGLALEAAMDDALSESTPAEMVKHMKKEAEEVAKLLGWSGKAIEELWISASTNAALGGAGRHWKYYEEPRS